MAISKEQLKVINELAKEFSAEVTLEQLINKSKNIDVKDIVLCISRSDKWEGEGVSKFEYGFEKAIHKLFDTVDYSIKETKKLGDIFTEEQLLRLACALLNGWETESTVYEVISINSIIDANEVIEYIKTVSVRPDLEWDDMELEAE